MSLPKKKHVIPKKQPKSKLTQSIDADWLAGEDAFDFGGEMISNSIANKNNKAKTFGLKKNTTSLSGDMNIKIKYPSHSSSSSSYNTFGKKFGSFDGKDISKGKEYNSEKYTKTKYNEKSLSKAELKGRKEVSSLSQNPKRNQLEMTTVRPSSQMNSIRAMGKESKTARTPYIQKNQNRIKLVKSQPQPVTTTQTPQAKRTYSSSSSSSYSSYVSTNYSNSRNNTRSSSSNSKVKLLKSGTTSNNALTISDSEDEEEEECSNQSYLFFGLHQVGKCKITWPNKIDDIKKEKKDNSSSNNNNKYQYDFDIMIELSNNQNKLKIVGNEINSIYLRNDITINGYGVKDGISGVYIKTKIDGPFYKMMMNKFDDDIDEDDDGFLILFENKHGTNLKTIYELFNQQIISSQSTSSSLSNNNEKDSQMMIKFDDDGEYLTNAMLRNVSHESYFTSNQTSPSPRRSLRKS